MYLLMVTLASGGEAGSQNEFRQNRQAEKSPCFWGETTYLSSSGFGASSSLRYISNALSLMRPRSFLGMTYTASTMLSQRPSVRSSGVYGLANMSSIHTSRLPRGGTS